MKHLTINDAVRDMTAEEWSAFVKGGFVEMSAQTIGGGKPSDEGDVTPVFHTAPGKSPCVYADTYQATAALLGLAMGEARKWKRRFYVALVDGWFYIGADMLDRVGLPWMAR